MRHRDISTSMKVGATPLARESCPLFGIIMIVTAAYNHEMVRVDDGRTGVPVRPSSLRISRSRRSTLPEPSTPRTPCLSNKYVSRFFLSSASPSSSANRCASSRSTTCAAMMAAAAASRITSDDVSVNAAMSVCFKRGSSSSRTSAGRRKANLARAIRPNAYELAFASSEYDGGTGVARKDTRAAWRVVRPKTASTRAARASRRVFVASKT
jgi:hypothetical protein